MSPEQPPSGHATPPQSFGPVRPHRTDHREDHERGWQEATETPEGRVPPARAAPRVTLAAQFRERLEQGPERTADT
jgi:hypothetical protein